MSEKFKLFDGVFGASDEVLGASSVWRDRQCLGAVFESKQLAETFQADGTIEEVEEFLIFAAFCDDGTELDTDLCQKLLLLPAEISSLDLAIPIARITQIRNACIQTCLTNLIFSRP